MKTLIIACMSCFLVPTEEAELKRIPVFVCGACNKEFVTCQSCGNGAEGHDKFNHVPQCPCGGHGHMKK